jgi:hypothetical protein
MGTSMLFYLIQIFVFSLFLWTLIERLKKGLHLRKNEISYYKMLGGGFDDITTKEVDWSSLVKGGANIKTHTNEANSSSRLVMKRSTFIQFATYRVCNAINPKA